MNWEVLECEFDSRLGVVRIRIGETAHLWDVERSPGEGARVKLYDHTEELVWRHLNVFERRCEIRPAEGQSHIYTYYSLFPTSPGLQPPHRSPDAIR
jgi:transposase